jgi:hypothetical protein
MVGEPVRKAPNTLQLVQPSRERAAQAGVAHRVQFIHGDFCTNGISPSAVVVLHLID